MGRAVIRTVTDTWVGQQYPSANFSTTKTLGVRGGASAEARAYIYFPRPFPLGATITSATLRLYSNAAWPAVSRTFRVYRTGALRVGYQTMTWLNRPGHYTTTSAVLTRTTAQPLGSEWAFNIQPLMQQVSNGGTWTGLAITGTEDAMRFFTSSQSTTDARRPVIEIEWSDRPDAPTTMRPAGGRIVSKPAPRLMFDYTDVSGNVRLSAIQVQTSASSAFTSLTYDSGWKATDDPEWDLISTSFPPLPVGGTTWWRARVRDGAGLESGWSSPAQFGYRPLGSVTITSPTSIYLGDVTPTVLWTFTGGTQRAYQVILTRPDQPGTVIWTTGKVTSTDTAVTVPRRAIMFDGIRYRITVRVWDSYDRESIVDAPAFVERSSDFTLDMDAAVTGVTGLKASSTSPYPDVRLTWSRASAPDTWTIVRDGRVIESGLTPAETQDGAGYSWTDETAQPRTDHVYHVRAVVAGNMSKSNPSATGRSEPVGIWLTHPGSGIRLRIEGQDEGDESVIRNSVVMRAHGSSVPAVIWSGDELGREGRVEGVFVDRPYDLPAQTSEWKRKTFNSVFSSRPGREYVLTMGAWSRRVEIYNALCTATPQLVGGELAYRVSFDWVLTDPEAVGW